MHVSMHYHEANSIHLISFYSGHPYRESQDILDSVFCFQANTRYPVSEVRPALKPGRSPKRYSSLDHNFPPPVSLPIQKSYCEREQDHICKSRTYPPQVKSPQAHTMDTFSMERPSPQCLLKVAISNDEREGTRRGSSSQGAFLVHRGGGLDF